LLALITGITVGLFLPGLSGVLFAICGAFMASAFFAWRGRPLCLLPLVLFFLLGYWSLQGWVAPTLPPHHVTHFIDGKPWHIMGTVEGPPQEDLERTGFILKVESITRKQLCYNVIGSIRITVLGKGLHLRSGDRVACLAKLKEIGNFNNPGGFNYKRYMAFRGIRASAYVPNKDLLVKLHGEHGSAIGSRLNRCREAVSALIEVASEGDDKEARGILKALIIGDRRGISAEDRRAFSRIGISHLLAISGLHVGMVATLCLLVFRYVLARSRRVLMAAWATRGAALMSVVPVLFYGFLAGMPPATQRAVIMVTVFLFALLFEREHDSINTLAVAAMIILTLTPTALFEISFQLSFLAVFSILYALRNVPFVSALRSSPGTLYKRLGLFLFVSAAAILGTLPFSLYYFNQTSLIGLFSNCLMVPLVGFLVVPMGLLAAFLLFITPTVALWIMKTAALILEGCISMAHYFSTWPFAAVRTITPTWMEMGLYYGLAWVLLSPRKTRFAKVALPIIVILALTDVAYWATRRFANDQLRVTHIDVGQGNAALLELPKGACMLIDGGGFYDNRFDVGARIVAPFLWQNKIATVETLVLSHPDPDHLNGLVFIARHFNVQQVWMTGDDVSSAVYKEFQDILSEEHIRVVGLEDLARPRTNHGVTFQVLYPPPDFLERKGEDPRRSTNNNSLVLRVSYNQRSFLFPGDIEAEAEQELIALAGGALKSDVLLVPHHGSKTSSTPGFLKQVDPDIAVISAGRKEIFGLPCEKILQRYVSWGSQVLRTHEAGAITITTDGDYLRVKTFLSNPSES
jgi:competence protein ComEC